MSKNYRSDDATALVGMPELVVGAQLFRDGEWWLNVETPASAVWCHGCGCRAVGHGRTRTQVRDLPIAGAPTVLVFARRRWRPARRRSRRASRARSRAPRARPRRTLHRRGSRDRRRARCLVGRPWFRSETRGIRERAARVVSTAAGRVGTARVQVITCFLGDVRGTPARWTGPCHIGQGPETGIVRPL